MGYSEVRCHLCGVSFNIGRLRTLEEVQTLPALSPELLVDLARYTENARYSLNQCRGMDGCKSLKNTLLNGSTEKMEDDEEEEHIPGPNCIHGGGYQGRSISVQEMHGCCTVQCLMPKPSDFQPENDDQEIEKTGDFFLTGLSDFMPSRDMDYPTMFPARHNCNNPPADNCFWSADKEHMTGMPFHPACLEVYKRASLHTSGKVDVQGLMDWFRLEAKYQIYNSFPRSEAVKRAKGQWWMHKKGDEHLAANPCFVPGLQKIFRTHTRKLAYDEDWCCNVSGVRDTAPFSSKANDEFAKLPYELRIQILFKLESPDIINLRLASRAFRSLPQSVFRTLLLRKKPWIWEAWCTLPYSFWAMTTSASLEKQHEGGVKEQKDFDDSVNILLKGFDDLSDSQEQEIHSLWDPPKYAAEGKHVWQMETSVHMLAPTQTDWCAIFIETEKRENILGLMNRERIWRDCEEILDRIERLRRERSIRPACD